MRHPLADTAPASARRSRRVPLRVVVVVALSGAALAAAVPAAAHDTLVASDPAADSTVTEAPTEVVLTFGAEQTDLGAEVVVTGADGGQWSDGPARVAQATVTQPLTGPLPDGAYTVTWRSVAGDGHPVTGTFAFTVAATDVVHSTAEATGVPATAVPATAVPATAVPATAVPATAAPALPESRADTPRPAWAWAALGLGVGGLVAGGLAVRRRRVSHD